MTKQTSYRKLLLKTHQMVFVDILEAYIKVELARTIITCIMYCFTENTKSWDLKKYFTWVLRHFCWFQAWARSWFFYSFLFALVWYALKIFFFFFVLFLSSFQNSPLPDIAATMFSMNRALRLTLLNYLRQIPYRLLQAKMWIHFSQDIWTSYMNILKVPVPKYLVNEFSLN